MKKKKNVTKRIRRAGKIIVLVVIIVFACPILARFVAGTLYKVGEEYEKAQISAAKAQTAQNIPTLEPIVEQLWSETFLESEDTLTDEYYPYLRVHYYATQCITGKGIRHYFSIRSIDEIANQYSVHFAQNGWDVSRCSDCELVLYHFDKSNARVSLWQDNRSKTTEEGTTYYTLWLDYGSPARCRSLP